MTASQGVASLEPADAMEPGERTLSEGPYHPAAPAPRNHNFRLLRYFSIASLIVLVLAVAALTFFFRQTALRQLVKVGEESNLALATVFANTLRPRYLPLVEAAGQAQTEALHSRRQLASLHDAVLSAVRQTNVVRVRIYDLAGRTLYSTEPRQVGEEHGTNPDFISARAGAVRTTFQHHESFDGFGRTLSDRELVASHVPIRRADGHTPEAVFELYSDVTPYFDEIRRTQRKLRIGVAIVVVLLYGALFAIVKRADTLLRTQEAQRHRDEETIRHLAHHDTLTGLPNRKLFGERLAFSLSRANRSGHMVALVFVDLDRFKHINDSFGHAVGDKVLDGAARVLRGSLRDIDTVARLGGDEFTIILEDIVNVGQVETVAEKIQAAFSAPLVTENGVDISVHPSMGIALYPINADGVEALLHAADAAMYDAKTAGRNTYRFYRAERSS